MVTHHQLRVAAVVLLCSAGTILVFHLYNNSNRSNNNSGEQQQSNNLLGQFSSSNSSRYTENATKAAAEENENSGHKNWTSRQCVIRFKNMRLKYRLEFATACPEPTKVVMLSMTRRDGFAKRMNVRQTWMNDSLPAEVIRFLVADADEKRSEANDTQKKLEEEQTEHGDLVFMHGFSDQYEHLHLKWYAGLQWQQLFCANAEWVMKVDDDAVLHLRRLAHWIDAKFRQIAVQHSLLAYIGHVLFHPDPIRNKNEKWYISEEVYPRDWYPSFMQGAVYLTTCATIRAILLHAPEIVGFYLDDVVFTGILGELANVTLSDQKNHFRGSFNLNEGNVDCVNGTPTAFSMSGFLTQKDYEYHYARLKALKCNKNLN